MDPVIGNITIFAGNFAPVSYMFCQGQLLSIAEYTPLFAIIGTTYGGDGQSTFALPDLRGRAPIGTGQGPGLNPVYIGEMAGVPSTTLISSNLPMHTHAPSINVTLKINDEGGDQASPVGNFIGVANAQIYNTAASTGEYMAGPPVINPSSVTGGNTPFNNMMPYLALNYIIAVEGIFPSRN